jgi:hypothetical protein
LPHSLDTAIIVWAHNPGTRTFKPVGDGLFYAKLHLASRDGERFYGMGENATGRVNLKGSVIDLYQRHVKAVVPLVVSSEGYGFLWNNPSLGRGASGKRTRSIWASVRSGSIRAMNFTRSKMKYTGRRSAR